MKTVHHWSIAAALVLACTAATAASPQAENGPVALTFDPWVTDVKPLKLAGTCTINVVAISDARRTRDGIGADAPVPAGPPEAWIKSTLDSLKKYGFTVQHGNTPLPNAVNLDVRVTRAYTWHNQMRINSMLALDVAVSTAQGSSTEKFRAAASKTNVWGANSEHVTALNYAANSMVFKMAPALKKKCAGVTLAGLQAR